MLEIRLLTVINCHQITLKTQQATILLIEDTNPSILFRVRSEEMIGDTVCANAS